MSEVIASAKFVRDDSTREVQVVKASEFFKVQVLMNGKLPTGIVDNPHLFDTLEDAMNKMGAASLAGYRNMLTMARWSEVAA